jgi:hypothetical protein
VTGWNENDRGVSYTFGPDVVEKFLRQHDLELVCRAHQVVEDGYEFFAKRSLVTIFSAPNYCGEFDNAGAMMSVDESLLCSFQVSATFVIIEYSLRDCADPEARTKEAEVRRMAGCVATKAMRRTQTPYRHSFISPPTIMVLLTRGSSLVDCMSLVQVQRYWLCWRTSFCEDHPMCPGPYVHISIQTPEAYYHSSYCVYRTVAFFHRRWIRTVYYSRRVSNSCPTFDQPQGYPSEHRGVVMFVRLSIFRVLLSF